MITINENFLKLNSSYLFSQISQIVEETQITNPNLKIIKLGIGDVTRALPSAIIAAFHEGVEDMSKDETFRGYGPEQGYPFLRDLIAKHDFQDRGIHIQPDEIIISDGSKCDVGNFQEIFSKNIRIAVPDPVYPVYVDTNVMSGRTGQYNNGHYEKIYYLSASEKNQFVPILPKDIEVDLIYLCFPNNPTGATATKAQLQSYVEYALYHKALILFDAAYCEYISDSNIPKSIFEIEGADECAVEFRSFSKTAGFTGTRCAFTVIPHKCRGFTFSGEQVKIRDLWLRRHTTKFNGVSYPVQKAAAAVYSKDGQTQIKDIISYYMNNAHIILNTIKSIGLKAYGGTNAPFIWVKSPQPSWEFFQKLLSNTGVLTTPGSGFGPAGNNFIRISAFNHLENVEEAMFKITQLL